MLVMPFAKGGRVVHSLDRLTPSSGVIGTKRNLALLCCDYCCAGLNGAQIEIEEILEPHAQNNEEPPVSGFVRSLCPPLAGAADSCYALLKQLVQISAREVRRGSGGVEPGIHSGLNGSNQIEASYVLLYDPAKIAKKSLNVDETAEGHYGSCFGVDDQRACDSAARSCRANHRCVASLETICQVPEQGEGARGNPVP